MPIVRSKIIGIVGTRRRDSEMRDLPILLKAFKKIYERGDSIVSGGCEEGADRFAELLAKNFCSITIHWPRHEDLHPELVETNPRAAWAIINFARNTLIAQDCNILIAMVAPDRKGGTEDTIKKAKKLGKKVIII